MSVDNSNIERILKRYRELLESDNRHLNDVTSRRNTIEDTIENYNDDIKAKNEAQKLEFRNKILKLISKLVWIQLFFFNIVVTIIISSLVFNFSIFKELEINISVTILDFLKYYISVTIVELLSMLLFIMQYVFNSKARNHKKK